MCRINHELNKAARCITKCFYCSTCMAISCISYQTISILLTMWNKYTTTKERISMYYFSCIFKQWNVYPYFSFYLSRFMFCCSKQISCDVSILFLFSNKTPSKCIHVCVFWLSLHETQTKQVKNRLMNNF